VRLRWPEHANAVSLFGTGDSEHGPWLAMRLVDGGTLETRSAPLDGVADALTQAHGAGLVHGDVSARNVLVAGGRAYLPDFGLGPADATAEDDLAALARLRSEHAPRRARAPLAGAAVLVAIAAGLALALANAGETDDGVPAPPAGTRPLGSDLAPGGIGSVDCNGRPRSGTSLACTISQRELAGRAVTVPVDGTIRSWAVRGARGTLALQVLRGRGARLVQVDRSADAVIPDTRVHVVRSDLAVAAGDRVALLVAPDAEIGIRRGGKRATNDRWFGPLLEPARRPERPAGTGLDHELLLRVDVDPRGGIGAIAPLSAAAAARAPAGRRVAARDVNVRGRAVRTVAVVVLGSAVALDLFDGTRRVARTPVPHADGRGELIALTGGERSVHVRWRNPRGAVVARRRLVRADGFS
jgi:hypothetical protein